ncbi:uncharacterized protein HaLaN_14168, partial [Haematococcus lacustris]
VFADNAHKNFSRGNVGDHLALMACYDGWAESNFSTQWCYENYVQVRSMKRARDIRDQLVATVCAMVSIGASVFYRPKDKKVFADNAHKNFSRGNVGDHLALMACYDGWAESNFSTQWCYENYVQVRSMKRARDIRDQLVGLMERVEIEMTSNAQDHDGVKKAVAAGYFYNCARLQRDGSYRTVKHPQTVHLHPSSSLAEVLPRWVVYHELVLTTKEYMRTISEIKPEWLVEIAPHFYSKQDVLEDGRKLPKGKGKAAMDG